MPVSRSTTATVQAARLVGSSLIRIFPTSQTNSTAVSLFPTRYAPLSAHSATAFFADIFPGRTEVPKTLIFAKDDRHADDIVKIMREEFGNGNDFAQEITYRTGAAKVRTKKTDKDGNEYEVDEWVCSAIKPEDLLSKLRTAYNPRIAVTVEMVATGTDIKPLEDCHSYASG